MGKTSEVHALHKMSLTVVNQANQLQSRCNRAAIAKVLIQKTKEYRLTDAILKQ